MKKLIILALAFFAINLSLSAQNMEQRAINRAEAVARQCIAELGYPSNLELVSSAAPNQSCRYINNNPNDMGYKVVVYGRTQCPPNLVCIQVIYPIATVYVDCSGQIESIECGTASE
jgi:hypothetical protein